jgi:hypothetical protein
MLDIVSKINERLGTLQKPLLNLVDVQGKNIEEKL